MLHDLSSADALRVPVERARVEIRTEHERRKAVIFLTPGTSPADLFEEDAPFFPADVGKGVLLVSRAAVVSVAVDAEDAPDHDRGSLADVGVHYEPRQLAVKLRSGDIVRGNVMTMTGTSRMLDLLNQPARSFALHVEGKVLHIAKAHVEEVEELP